MRLSEETNLKSKISRGQTYPGVYEAIIGYLQSLRRSFDGKKFFDIPCGRGEFLSVLRGLFPASQLLGGDIDTAQFAGQEKVYKMDATEPFPFDDDMRFDVITSISGLVMFDNSTGFIRNCVSRLNEGGLLIVANENTFSARDRIIYLLLGRFRTFPLFLQPHQVRYKRIPIEELCKIFAENGLNIEKVQYLVYDKVDYLFVPFACVLFLLQALYCLLKRSSIPVKLRFQMFPFSSLLSRYYFVVCRKTDCSLGTREEVSSARLHNFLQHHKQDAPAKLAVSGVTSGVEEENK